MSVERPADDAHAIAGFEFHFFGSEEAQIVLCGGAEGDETLHLRLIDEGDAVARDGRGATGAGHRLQGLATHVEVEFLPVTVLHKLLEVFEFLPSGVDEDPTGEQRLRTQHHFPCLAHARCRTQRHKCAKTAGYQEFARLFFPHTGSTENEPVGLSGGSGSERGTGI